MIYFVWIASLILLSNFHIKTESDVTAVLVVAIIFAYFGFLAYISFKNFM